MSMPEILPPEILTAAEAAWGRAQEGQVHTGKNIGSTAIFGALDSAAREESRVGFGALEGITDLEIKKLFERDIKDYKAIFAGAGIDMPTPAEFAQGGIDFRHLAELKEERPDYDLVVAPLTLPLGAMCQFVSRAYKPKPNIKSTRYASRLFVDDEVADDWKGIMKGTMNDWQLPVVGDNKWTAFMLFNREQPQDRGLSYDQTKRLKAIVPVVGYAAYQMHRIRQGMSPVDTGGVNSWVASEFSINYHAHALYIGWNNPDSDRLMAIRGCDASLKMEDVGSRAIVA